MTIQERKKKALKRALLALAICAIPLGYLAYKYQTNVTMDVENFGVAPEFTMIFHNNKLGMTHNDTLQHLTVVAVAKDHCKNGCPKFLKELEELRAFYEQELQARIGDRHAPRETRFVVQATEGLEFFPDTWLKADMSLGTPYLVPEVKKSSDFPAVVLIDDSSYFRGFASSGEAGFHSQLTRELTRMTSSRYLLHYVTQQTLMWQKANGRKPRTAQSEAENKSTY